MDNQSVRWGNNCALNGFNGNKKVKGIKRHVVVDRNGFLLAITVTVVNVHDSKAVDFLMITLAYFLSLIKIILADGGYRREVIEKVKSKFGYLINVVMRNDEKKKILSLFPKDGLLRELSLGLIMIEDCAETTNY